MSYHVYTTDGIILKRAASGEANLVLYILTRDLGLIIAGATSARLLSSKLRTGLQEFSFISLSCVKGKNGWKMTNVAYKDSFYFNKPYYLQKIIAQITSVLLTTIAGELPHPEIFETFKSGLEHAASLPQGKMRAFEALILIRILFELGYVAKNSATEEFLTHLSEWNDMLLVQVEQRREELVSLVNKALKESQM